VRQPGPRWRSALLCALLAAAIFAAYGAVGNHEFVSYDDPKFVMEPHVKDGFSVAGVRWALTALQASNWHPITTLSHMLDCELFGTDWPGGHHLTNVLLHAVNSSLLFLLFLRMTGAFWRSALVAAVFALHPVHVESVAWVAERKDVLSTAFWLSCILAYVEYTRVGLRRYYALCLLALALGLMAKPMLVTAPFLLLLLDYWPLGRLAPVPAANEAAADSRRAARPLGALLVEKLPMLLLVALLSAITLGAQRVSGNNISVDGLRNALVAYARYLGKSFWPTDMAVFYPYRADLPDAVVLGAGLLLLAITAGVVVLHRQRYLTVGWLWFLGTLFPVIGFVRVGSHALADRYLYIPMTGLLVMVIWGVADLLGRFDAGARRGGLAAAIVAAAAVVGLFLWLTPQQVAKWKDSRTLYSHALAVTEDNALAHYNLGVELEKVGETDAAIDHFRETIRVEPGFARAYNNLGVALASQARFDEAVEQFQRALRFESERARAEQNLALARLRQGEKGSVNELMRSFLRQAPDGWPRSVSSGARAPEAATD